eukprot:TRINITY_DN8595_c0_g1_i1.p1 TRINITY_DN8595_c0_g1~~TRINITY_DN8595_c0_g1_i1.p1  ORF type:complete len:353 (-),score=49.68 TRINITY_DN8595_c0_g1_i1:38-1096(-)
MQFSVHEESDYLDYFRRHGLVVIRSVLSPAEVEATIEGIWQELAAIGAERSSPATWATERWPNAGKGFFSAKNDLRDRCAWQNRQNPELVRIFQVILQQQELYVVRDRYGIMRPTEGRPEWKTSASWMHWDQNPWRTPGFHGVQGMIALTHNTSANGCFACVPGFHTKFAEWSKAHPPDSEGAVLRDVVPVPSDDPLQDQLLAVEFPAGSVVIWDSRLPHQNLPNSSAQFRMVQYVTFTKVPADQEFQHMVQRRVQAEVASMAGGVLFPAILTPLGRRLVGLDLWGTAPGSHEPDQQDRDPESTPEIGNDARLDALALAAQAQLMEAEGDAMGAMALYRRAIKLNPALEQLL